MFLEKFPYRVKFYTKGVFAALAGAFGPEGSEGSKGSTGGGGGCGVHSEHDW